MFKSNLAAAEKSQQLKSQASWPLFVQVHVFLAKLPCLMCEALWLESLGKVWRSTRVGGGSCVLGDFSGGCLSE